MTVLVQGKAKSGAAGGLDRMLRGISAGTDTLPSFATSEKDFRAPGLSRSVDVHDASDSFDSDDGLEELGDSGSSSEVSETWEEEEEGFSGGASEDEVEESEDSIGYSSDGEEDLEGEEEEEDETDDGAFFASDSDAGNTAECLCTIHP